MYFPGDKRSAISTTAKDSTTAGVGDSTNSAAWGEDGGRSFPIFETAEPFIIVGSCKECGREFGNAKSLEKHERICASVFAGQRRSMGDSGKVNTVALGCMRHAMQNRESVGVRGGRIHRGQKAIRNVSPERACILRCTESRCIGCGYDVSDNVLYFSV